jgi:mono/diheme cytochrome c family protein
MRGACERPQKKDHVLNISLSTKTSVKPSIFGVVALALCTVSAVHAQEISVTQGRRIAEANCASCHAVGKVGDSPMPIAPPFRNLHTKYPVEHLEESLAEGITTGHPTMPEFRFESDQVRDFIAYLKSLESR